MVMKVWTLFPCKKMIHYDCSIVDSQNKNLYLHERPDLKQHLHDKVARGDIPAWLGKSMLEESENMFEDDEVGA